MVASSGFDHTEVGGGNPEEDSPRITTAGAGSSSSLPAPLPSCIKSPGTPSSRAEFSQISSGSEIKSSESLAISDACIVVPLKRVDGLRRWEGRSWTSTCNLLLAFSWSMEKGNTDSSKVYITGDVNTSSGYVEAFKTFMKIAIA